MAGCTSWREPVADLPTWELASAEPSACVSLVRTRVSFDRPLPPRLTQELCPEFLLITVNRPADWAELRRRLDLPDNPVPMDFSRGMIVGIQANVGEFAERPWPIRVETVRIRTGTGRVEASFAPGLYYPLQTAGYVELVYVPGLQQISMVCVNHRTFLLHSSASLD